MAITSDAGGGSGNILPMLSGVTLLSSAMTPSTSELNVTLAGKPHRGFQRRRTDLHRGRSRRGRCSYRGFGSPMYELVSNTPDQQNRLVKELHGTHESAYEYDGASRRWRITEKENGTQTKQETFAWCGSRICQKRSGSTVVRSYFGQGFEESGPTKYFYTRDHLGSVREVVGADGATVASRLSYDPWGKVTETGSGALSDFTYTGHYADRATALNLTRFRGYDAALGRWLSRDPIGLAGGLNLYGYVNNDPINLIDPLGLDPFGGGEAVVESQWDASPEERQSWDEGRGIGAGLGMAVVAGFAGVQAVVLRIGATAAATASATGGAVADRCSNGGWQAYMGQAADRVASTAARFGNSNAVAISRKVALDRVQSLTPQVEKHLAKLAADPNSRDAHHWGVEIRGWLNAMERVLPALGGKTGAEWAQRIADWRKALGD